METREISTLKINPQNPRGAVTHDVALRELAMSISSVGVIEPIIITPNDLIVAGHRRVEAAKLANLTEVPVIVRKVSQSEQLQIMLIENLQRASLNLLQEGAAYIKLVEYGLTPSQISKTIGVAGSRVANCVAVQGLTEDTQRRFAWGEIHLSCAIVLAALPIEAQETWAERAATGKMNGAALQDAIKNPSAQRKSPQYKTKIKSTLPSSLRSVRDMIQWLEAIDEHLESSPHLRPVQSLIRQAVTQLIEKGAMKPPPIKRVEDMPHESKSLASVSSFAMRKGQTNGR